MSEPGSRSVVYRFGAFTLDTDAAELSHEEDRIEIQPRVLDVLSYLVRHRDRVVSRAEVLDALWGDAVVGEHALTTAVHEARAALGDSHSRQWALKTVPRRGYRFVAEVEEQARDTGARHSSPRPAQRTADHGAPASAPEADIFVGRSAELAGLEAALEAAEAGRGRFVPVVGEPGIGKTRTVEELAHRAAARGFEVASGWCSESDGAPPFWPWVQILRALMAARTTAELRDEMGPAAADLVTIVPELRQQLTDLPESAPLEPNEERFRLFDAVARFLRSAASRRPVVLLVDDLHWADRSSLRLLEFLAREARLTRLLLVGTYREAESDRRAPLAEALPALARHASGQTVRLQGLSRAEIAELASRVSGEEMPAELIDAIASRTDGNPFFLREVLNLLVAERRTGSPSAPRHGPFAIPPGVRDAISRRLSSLSDGCLEALRIASLIGTAFDPTLVSRVADGDPAELHAGLAEACAAGVIRGVDTAPAQHRFTHALVRETLAAGLPSVERARLHRRIGEALEGLHAGHLEPYLEELAHHLLAAIPESPVRKAVDYARRAGEHAMRLHAFDEAARLHDLALQALAAADIVDPAQRYELLVWRAEAESAAGEFHRKGRRSFEEAIELARGLASPERLALAALALSLGAARSTSDAEVARGDVHLLGLLEEALDSLGDRSLALRAALQSRIALELVGPRTWERGAAFSKAGLELARQSDNVDTLVHAMNIRLLYLSGPEHTDARLTGGTEILRITRERHRLDLAPYGHRWRLVSYLELGEIAAADAEIEACARLGEAGRALSSDWWLSTVRSMRALLDGRLGDSERLCFEALQRVQRQPNPNATAIFGVQLSFVRRAQGRLVELEPILRTSVEPDLAEMAWAAYQTSLACFYAEMGKESEARDRFERFAERGFRDLTPDLTRLYCLALLAETACHLEDRPRAEQLYELMLPHAHRSVVLMFASACLGSAARYLGKLASLLERWDAAELHFEDALLMNGRMGARPWQAYTRCDLAQMLLARGRTADSDRAGELLARSLASARELGLKTLADHADALGAESRGAIPLRPRQRRRR